MQPILEINKLNKIYNHTTAAVQDIDLQIYAGEFLGLIGESGCGKSTLAKLITGLEDADSGYISIGGHQLRTNSKHSLQTAYRSIQMIFQTPLESFNPRQTLGSSLSEGLRNRGCSSQQAREKAIEYLHICGLDKSFYERYPHQASGGECQRAAIARALLLEPRLLICDEPTSALDVSTQAQIIKLLTKLKEQHKLACLFISHDIALAEQLCDRLAVMQQGRIIELGATEQVINNPQSQYTRELIDLAIMVQNW